MTSIADLAREYTLFTYEIYSQPTPSGLGEEHYATVYGGQFELRGDGNLFVRGKKLFTVKYNGQGTSKALKRIQREIGRLGLDLKFANAGVKRI